MAGIESQQARRWRHQKFFREGSTPSGSGGPKLLILGHTSLAPQNFRVSVGRVHLGHVCSVVVPPAANLYFATEFISQRRVSFRIGRNCMPRRLIDQVKQRRLASGVSPDEHCERSSQLEGDELAQRPRPAPDLDDARARLGFVRHGYFYPESSAAAFAAFFAACSASRASSRAYARSSGFGLRMNSNHTPAAKIAIAKYCAGVSPK